MLGKLKIAGTKASFDSNKYYLTDLASENSHSK